MNIQCTFHISVSGHVRLLSEEFQFLSYLVVSRSIVTDFVFLLKYASSCFSSHIRFLVLVVLLIIMLGFFTLFTPYVDEAMLSSMLETPPPPPSFLNTYSLSTSFLECKALYIVISFLFLWSINWIFLLVHFTNTPKLSYKWDSLSVYPFDEIPTAELGFEKFFVRLK